MALPPSQRTTCPPPVSAEAESYNAYHQSQTTLKLTKEVAELLCPAIGKLIEQEVNSLHKTLSEAQLTRSLDSQACPHKSRNGAPKKQSNTCTKKRNFPEFMYKTEDQAGQKIKMSPGLKRK